MTNKKHFSIYKLIAVIVAALSLSWVLMLSGRMTASANEDIEPYGLYTKINLNLNAGNGVVVAKAHNKFTLGKSTVRVDLYLYSSETYEDNYNLMKLENYGYVSDLDMNHSFEVKSSTNGVQKYWRAVMRYRLDSKDWVEKQSDTILISGYGDLLY